MSEDLQRIAKLVAEVDRLDQPTTLEEIEGRLRQISVARFAADKRIASLLADVEALQAKVHSVRNEDAAMLASADIEATHLRRGLLDALADLERDLPWEESRSSVAAVLRAALDAAESSER